MNPKHALVYVRVSTSEQADRGVSLDNQERACNEWAFRNGVQVLKLFREEGVSAKTLARPQMQQMLDYIADHASEIDYVIVYQIDRLTRSLGDFSDLIRFLGKYKVELHDSTSGIEVNESDELLQAIQAVLAQHDNRLKSKRVTENMKRHASQGFRMNQAPYGLRNIRDTLGRPTLEPVEPIAGKIKHLLKEYSTGAYTKGQLLREAQRTGLTQPNGKPMIYQYLDKLLRQPIYAGLERNSFTDGQIVASTFKGLVPEWVFYANQMLLDERKKSKVEGYKNIHPDFPLRKFILCAKCSQPLRGSSSTGRSGKKYPRYHCTTPSCHSAHTSPDDLHKQWMAHLQQLSPTQGRLKLVETIIIRVWHDEVKNMRLRRDQITKAADALDEERISAAEKVATGELTKAEKEAVVQRVNEKLVGLRRELNDLNKNIGTKQEAIEYAVNYIGNAARLWDNASPEGKQIFQRMVYPEGLPYDLTKKQFGTAPMSALYNLVADKKDPSELDESHLVTPAGVEPAISRMRTWRPGPLDEGALLRPRYLTISVIDRPERVEAMNYGAYCSTLSQANNGTHSSSPICS